MPQKFPKEADTEINFRRNLVKHHKLVGLYDEFFAKEIEGFTFAIEPKQKDDGWHPSGHCIPGVRELWHHAVDPHGDGFSLGVRKSFPVGHFWHQLLQFATVQMGLAKPEAIERRGVRGWGHTSVGAVRKVEWGDVPWAPFHYATGQGDIAPIEAPDFTGIVDFKTMNARDFKLAEGGLLPDWAEYKYEAQINIYMDFFDQDYGMIVGIQKDSPHNFCELVYERNQELIGMIYDKWEFVGECLDADVEPTPSDEKLFVIPEYVYQGAIQ